MAEWPFDQTYEEIPFEQSEPSDSEDEKKVKRQRTDPERPWRRLQGRGLHRDFRSGGVWSRVAQYLDLPSQAAAATVGATRPEGWYNQCAADPLLIGKRYPRWCNDYLWSTSEVISSEGYTYEAYNFAIQLSDLIQALDEHSGLRGTTFFYINGHEIKDDATPEHIQTLLAQFEPVQLEVSVRNLLPRSEMRKPIHKRPFTVGARPLTGGWATSYLKSKGLFQVDPDKVTMEDRRIQGRNRRYVRLKYTLGIYLQ